MCPYRCTCTHTHTHFIILIHSSYSPQWWNSTPTAIRNRFIFILTRLTDHRFDTLAGSTPFEHAVTLTHRTYNTKINHNDRHGAKPVCVNRSVVICAIYILPAEEYKDTQLDQQQTGCGLQNGTPESQLGAGGTEQHRWVFLASILQWSQS